MLATWTARRWGTAALLAALSLLVLVVALRARLRSEAATACPTSVADAVRAHRP